MLKSIRKNIFLLGAQSQKKWSNYNISKTIKINIVRLKIQTKNPLQQFSQQFFYNPFSKFSTSSQPSRIKQHLQLVNKVKASHGQTSMQMMQALHKLSFAHASQGNFQQAIRIYQSVVKTFKSHIDDTKSPALGDCLKNLQILYKRVSNFLAMIPITLQLIQIRIKQLGQNDKTIANQYHQLGLAYYQIENFQEAKNCYQKTMSIRELVLGKNTLQYIQARNNVSTTCYSLGLFKQAKDITLDNIQKVKQLDNYNQRMIITPMSNIAAIYQHQGNHLQSIKTYQQVQAIMLRLSLGQSYFLGNIYHSMGIIYLKINQIQKSQTYQQKSLSINQKALGQSHPNVAGNYHNLAICYQYQGKLQQALKYYNKSIEIKKKTLGDMHPAVAETYNNVGLLHKAMNNNTQARQIFNKALEIVRSLLKDQYEDSIMADLYMNVGATYLQETNAQKANEYFYKAQNIYKKHFEVTHPKFTELYFNMAKLQFTLTKNIIRTLQLLQIAIGNLTTLNPAHPNLYIQHYMKAQCLSSLAKHSQCLKSYLQALSLLEKNLKLQPQQKNMSLGELCYQISITYYYMKDFNEAQQMINKAIQIFDMHFQTVLETRVEFYFFRATLKLNQNNKSAARQAYQKAQELIQKMIAKAPEQQLFKDKLGQIISSIKQLQ